MTEAEWLTATDPKPMLAFLKASDRKWQLFACACCRHIWHLMPDDKAKEVIVTLELYADGKCSESELNAKYEQFAKSGGVITLLYLDGIGLSLAESHVLTAVGMFITEKGKELASGVSGFCSAASVANQTLPMKKATIESENLFNSDLIREVFGNPFRQVVKPKTKKTSINKFLSWLRSKTTSSTHTDSSGPSWLTPTVLALATGIYAEKAFDRMPILADALQDAGCDNEDVLNHCRKPGEHVRGCFVVDLVLGNT